MSKALGGKQMREAADALDVPAQALGQESRELHVNTDGKGFFEITGELNRWLNEIGAGRGLLTVFMSHTSASLLIQGNDDPNLSLDLLQVLDRLGPRNSNYRHNNEGPDDVPSHIKTMLTSVQLTIPVVDGKMALGRLQGVFVLEHRPIAHTRRVPLHFLGNLGTMAV